MMDITRQIQIMVAWADIILGHPIFKVILVGIFILIGYLIGRYIMGRSMKNG